MSRQRKKTTRTIVDIVIPVYGRFDLLEQCLNSIPDACGDISYQVYIFDNASPEKGTYYNDYNKRYENVQVIQSGENLGFPRACNRAARKGTSPYIFFLNSDVILFPDSIKVLVDRMNNDAKIGVMGMLLLFPDDVGNLNPDIRPAGKVQHAGMTCTISAKFIHQFVGWDVDNPRVQNMNGEVPAVTGAALLTRRNLFHQAGGFNEVYGYGTWEDVDLCLTVSELGYKIVVDFDAKAYHYVGATSESYNMNFNMRQNYNTFITRWDNKIQQSDWRYW